MLLLSIYNLAPDMKSQSGFKNKEVLSHTFGNSGYTIFIVKNNENLNLNFFPRELEHFLDVVQSNEEMSVTDRYISIINVFPISFDEFNQDLPRFIL